MSGNKRPTAKMTVEQLDQSSNKEAKYNIGQILSPSSTKKDKMEQTYDQTYDQRKFYRKEHQETAVKKYKKALSDMQKQLKTKPVFKPTTYIQPILEQSNIIKQKQNNFNNFNTQTKHAFSSPEAKINDSTRKIQWGSLTKSQTAEIVRKLYTTPVIDYNFQYRKKKFFQNFGLKQ